jgi:phage repressor protein C with HTH and peptisase S24 domain
MDGVKERLLSFIKDIGIEKSVFERTAGLSNGFVDKVTDNIRSKSLAAIANAYPQLNMDWIKTGEGSPIIPIQDKAIQVYSSDIKEGVYAGTLVYDVDATCGTEVRDIDFTDDNIIGSVDLPEISKSSKIIRANGDSMEPKIYDGSRIVIREIMNWSDIFYGQIYLIVMDEYRMIKYIRRYEQDEDNYIILRSENKEYDDIKLNKKKIRKLFIVENILYVKTQI